MSRDVVLAVNGISKSFRGLSAVEGVSFDVERGAIQALIGPNGAGKTTIFNLISGALSPDAGSVLLDGQSLAGKRPDEICRAGVGRTFQIVRPFNEMSVEENVAVGALTWTGDVNEALHHARDILRLLGLGTKSDSYPHEMTLPDRKCLEVARALATKPKILLLDEVMAGLRPSEADAMVETFRKINGETGVTILLIEHVMRAVMALSQRVVVVNYGKVIAEGTPAEVTSNATVLSCYIGTETVI